MRIEIHHPGGHVTVVPIDIPEEKIGNPFERVGRIQEAATDLLNRIGPLISKETKVFLIITSSANEQATI